MSLLNSSVFDRKDFMLPRICKGTFEGIDLYYRPNSSDVGVIREVIGRHGYRKPRFDFDVEPGESWLDLGANIGAFAAYCRLRKASRISCYEPEPNCFNLLRRNTVQFGNVKIHRCAVSHSYLPSVSFYLNISNRGFPGQKALYHRGRIVPVNRREGSREAQSIEVPNVFAGSLPFHDGVKMDIEGGEFGILDYPCIPKCDKMVLEYHTKIDRSASNLKHRLGVLHDTFKKVYYRPEYDKIIRGKSDCLTYYNRLIFCVGRK